MIPFQILRKYGIYQVTFMNLDEDYVSNSKKKNKLNGSFLLWIYFCEFICSICELRTTFYEFVKVR